MKKTIIFIGGVPGTGKTTLAYQLALALKIDKVISFDVIKSVAKLYIPCEQNLYLYSTTYESYLLEHLSYVDGFMKHSCMLEQLFINLLPSLSDEQKIIVEGAQLIPDIIKQINQEEYNIFYINLYCRNSSFLIERYYLKGQIRSYNWIDNIDIILQIQNHLLKFDNAIHVDTEKNDVLYCAMQLLKQGDNL